MIVRRGYRYRIYPDAEPTEILYEWEETLRRLWNHALGQRLSRSKTSCLTCKAEKCRDGKKWNCRFLKLPQVNYFQQQRELTGARKESQYLRSVPVAAGQGVLRDLDRSWQLWKRGAGGKPRFKLKGACVGMRLSNSFVPRWLADSTIKLPKIGNVEIVLHRPLPRDAVVKTLSVVRDSMAWHVSIGIELELPDVGESALPVVGIDRGVALTIADSDDRVAQLPRRIKRLGRRADRDQSRADKNGKIQKGSKRHKKARAKAIERRSKIARSRRYWLHSQANYYAENYGVVVIEDLKVKNMTKSAKGTLEDPGKNVKAKSGLNRSILEQGWSSFVSMLIYKMEVVGGRVYSVSPAFTSQTCSRCGHVDKESRVSQGLFICTLCGYEENADINAAKNIRNLHLNGESKLIGGYQVKKKPKNKLWIVKKQKSTGVPAGRVQACSSEI